MPKYVEAPPQQVLVFMAGLSIAARLSPVPYLRKLAELLGVPDWEPTWEGYR